MCNHVFSQYFRKKTQYVTIILLSSSRKSRSHCNGIQATASGALEALPDRQGPSCPRRQSLRKPLGNGIWMEFGWVFQVV